MVSFRAQRRDAFTFRGHSPRHVAQSGVRAIGARHNKRIPSGFRRMGTSILLSADNRVTSL
jgi:hypothetical protein